MAEIEVQIESVRQGTVSNEYTLMLKDKAAERFLPIYIRKSQALKIKELLVGAPLSKLKEPDPLDTIPADFKLISIIINKFEENEFFAKLRFRHGHKTKHFRVKLTEGVIESIREEVPILVDETVITKSGITI